MLSDMATSLLTSAEAAEVLGVNQRTIAQMVKTGRLRPHKRLGSGVRGAFLFTPDSVEDLRRRRAERTIA